MKNVMMFQENSVNANAQVLDQVFQLRHDTFIKRLGWEISSHQGRERDQFDDLNPFHITVTDAAGQQVLGCWRALPSQGLYMLKDVFPQLLQGEAAPQEENVWEISRFAVNKNLRDTEQGYYADTTIELVRSFYDFAIARGITSYVTVTTVACERILRQLGVTMRRLGDGKALQIGVERSVALQIEVNENLRINRH
jgi:acyl homoserine lactone synthase